MVLIATTINYVNHTTAQTLSTDHT